MSLKRQDSGDVIFILLPLFPFAVGWTERKTGATRPDIQNALLFIFAGLLKGNGGRRGGGRLTTADPSHTSASRIDRIDPFLGSNIRPETDCQGIIH